MKILKRIITIIVTIILLLILSFNLFNFISIKILGNKLPTINGYAYLEVISGSMEPKFSIGDIVIIDTEVEKYKVNDIVTFEDHNGSFVTHRIIEIKDDGIVTKGDANNTIDGSIDEDSIIGVYKAKIEGVGALIKSLRSPFVMIMILIIGTLLCVLFSTDSKGNPILTKEEKEYMEFLESKKKKEEIKIEKKPATKKVAPKVEKKSTTKKTETKVEKKPTAKKTETKVEKKSTTKKTETKVEKKPTTKKVAPKVEKKPTTKKTETKIEKKPTTKKLESKVEKKTQTKKTTSKK